MMSSNTRSGRKPGSISSACWPVAASAKSYSLWSNRLSSRRIASSSSTIRIFLEACCTAELLVSHGPLRHRHRGVSAGCGGGEAQGGSLSGETVPHLRLVVGDEYSRTLHVVHAIFLGPVPGVRAARAPLEHRPPTGTGFQAAFAVRVTVPWQRLRADPCQCKQTRPFKSRFVNCWLENHEEYRPRVRVPARRSSREAARWGTQAADHRVEFIPCAGFWATE